MQATGKVIRWDEARAFGFIRGTASAADVFFHIRDFRSDGAGPVQGLDVVYEEIHMGGKGPRAVAVRPAREQSRTQVPPRAQPRPVARPPTQTLANADPQTLTLERMHRSRHRGSPTQAGAQGRAPGRQPDRPQHASAIPRAQRSHELRQARRAAAHGGAQSSRAVIAITLMLMFAAAIVWGLSTRRLPVWMPVALMAVNVATFMAYWQDKYAASKKQWRTPEDALHIWSIAGGWPAAWLAQQLLRTSRTRLPSCPSTGSRCS